MIDLAPQSTRMPPDGRIQKIVLREVGICGFNLIEVAIALAVASFALVAILGLLPMGMSATRDAVQFTTASQIASAIDCDLRTSSFNGTSALYKIPLQTGTNELYLDNLGSTNATPATAQFRARIVINPPVGAFPPYASILLAWPAAATITSNSSRLEVASFLQQ